MSSRHEIKQMKEVHSPLARSSRLGSSSSVVHPLALRCGSLGGSRSGFGGGSVVRPLALRCSSSGGRGSDVLAGGGGGRGLSAVLPASRGGGGFRASATDDSSKAGACKSKSNKTGLHVDGVIGGTAHESTDWRLGSESIEQKSLSEGALSRTRGIDRSTLVGKLVWLRRRDKQCIRPCRSSFVAVPQDVGSSWLHGLLPHLTLCHRSEAAGILSLGCMASGAEAALFLAARVALAYWTW